jgi:hypothetical protein
MNRALFAVVLTLSMSGGVSAQTPNAGVVAAPARLPPGWQARPVPAPVKLVPLPFGCEARDPNVCYFRIFYTRGDRVVILDAGMKEKKVPAAIGGEYCVTLNKAPAPKCTRKVINDKYNS